MDGIEAKGAWRTRRRPDIKRHAPRDWKYHIWKYMNLGLLVGN